jgi:hypothetical protein
MTSIDQPRIRISDPAELIDLVPYLIGFHPYESLVIVGFGAADDRDGPGPMQVALRADLGADSASLDELPRLIEALARSSARYAIAVLITEEHGPSPRQQPSLQLLTSRLGQCLTEADITLLDLLLADEQRWWSLTCADEECCPMDGLPRFPGTSVSAAQATMAGLVAYTDREELEGLLAPASYPERVRLEPALAIAEHRVTKALLDNGLRRLRRTDLAALLREMSVRAQRVDTAGKRLTDAKLARFAVALTDLEIRDAVWVAIDAGSVECESLLHEMLTRLPEPYDAAPLFLYAWTQWRHGRGTLAGMAAERALLSDPGYSAADLLLTAVGHGLDPRTTPRLSEPEAD